jgi:general secretion pathway protein G
MRRRNCLIANDACGFTIVELLVVMAILGVLAVAVMPLGETLVVAQKERELHGALSEIRRSLDEYKRAADKGDIVVGTGASGYPSSLRQLVEGVPDARSQTPGGRHFFLRRVPRDPFADPALSPELTWRLRSYASSAERPEAGVDVYDIRSSSDGVGLDGTPYAEW